MPVRVMTKQGSDVAVVHAIPALSVRGSFRQSGRSLPPAAVLIRPDGYVAWVGVRTQDELHDALTTWFGRHVKETHVQEP